MNSVAASIRVQFRRAGMRAIHRKRVIAAAQADLQGFERAVDDLAGHSQAGHLGRRQRAGVTSRIAGVVDVQCIAVPVAVDCQHCTDRIDIATGDRGRAADVDGICIRPRVDGRGSGDRLNMNRIDSNTGCQFGGSSMRAFDCEFNARIDWQRNVERLPSRVTHTIGHLQSRQAILGEAS